MTLASSNAEPRARTGGLDQPERLLVALIVVIATLSVALAAAKSQAVAWAAFGWSFLPAIGVIVVGLYLRGPKAAPRLSHFAIANGIYIGFSGVIAILIYLRFPIAIPLIDDQLARLDAAVGFDWEGFVHLMAQYPAFGSLLGPVYLSSLPQLFILIAALSLTGQAIRLNRALLAGTISLILTVCFWWVFPSIGPAAHVTIPTEVEQAIGLFHDDRLGNKLISLVAQGTPLIHPADIMGTIAFPSYHTVMMLMVLFYLRGMILFWPALALNALMVPAILSHGGHYLMDVVGGVIAFALAAWIATRLVKDTPEQG